MAIVGNAGSVANTIDVEIGAGVSDVEKEIFSEYKPAQFTVGGLSFGFPVLKIDEMGSNRLIERERPYRDGAKLDDTGAKATRWTFECIFENSITDEGLGTINQGRNLYPDVLNGIIELFKIHETGDLVIPTVGKRRCRAEAYRRLEDSSQRDCAMLTLVFTEDNEDSVNSSSIQAPTAGANARQLASSTEFDANAAGSLSDTFLQLREAMIELEELAAAPGSTIQSIRNTNALVESKALRTKQNFQRPGRTGRDLLLDPSNSRVERKLVQMTELSAKAANEARRGRPKLVQVIFREDTSLFRVSIVVGQPFEDLLEVNPNLDPFFIRFGTIVNVYASQELLNGSVA
jgi:hypothetical protein